MSQPEHKVEAPKSQATPVAILLGVTVVSGFALVAFRPELMPQTLAFSTVIVTGLLTILYKVNEMHVSYNSKYDKLTKMTEEKFQAIGKAIGLAEAAALRDKAAAEQEVTARVLAETKPAIIVEQAESVHVIAAEEKEEGS